MINRYKHAFLLFPVIVMLSCNSKKENDFFTGTINYTYSYTSDSLNADSIASTRTSKSDFRYDLNDYQSRFIAQDTETYYYSGKLNKCVGETNGQHNFTCEDYSIMTDSVLSWKIYDTEEKILGRKCRILEMQKSNSWVQYYVSTEMKIAPATYQQHRAYNWDIYGEKAGGGLILKSEHRFKRFTMKGIVTDLEEHPKEFKALEIDKKLMDSLCAARN